jgi:azurin
MGLNGGALHALWTMHGLGALDGSNEEALQSVIDALSHPAPGVRKAAIQVLPKSRHLINVVVDSDIIKDVDPHTQLAALLAISEVPGSHILGQKLYELSKSTDLIQDLWLSQALFIAANQHKGGFIDAYQEDNNAVDYVIPAEEKKEEIPSVWNKWDDPQEVTRNWPSFQSGQAWEQTELPEFDGRVIAYKEVYLKTVPKSAFLHLGRIGQSDRGFINGTMLHETRNDPEKLRIYEVPVSSLKRGMNYILLTITDNEGPGGLLGPNDQLFLRTDQDNQSIAGEWKYYVQERKSRGINYSEFEASEPLGARFIAYNTGPQANLNQSAQSDPDAVKISLSAVRNQMTYDQLELVVPAGKTIEIVFENPDLMQHNLLIIAPGSLETVGKAADELARSPDGQEKQYIPQIPQVLYASPLVNPGGTYVLRFTAPEEPGAYPFVCTFPGHWQTMNGIMKVEGVVN